LYDLLQFGFGERNLNDLERRSDEAEWERVVLARGIEVGEGEDEAEAEAEVDASAASGRYDPCVWPCAITGDATREPDGLLAGMLELGLYRSVGACLGTKTKDKDERRRETKADKRRLVSMFVTLTQRDGPKWKWSIFQ
jgi:hypothetical protein